LRVEPDGHIQEEERWFDVSDCRLISLYNSSYRNGKEFWFRNIGSFVSSAESDAEPRLMGWIKKIVVNTAIDELRKHNLMPQIGGIPENIWDEPNNTTGADSLLLYKELICHVKKLPPSYGAVFNMYVIDGFSHQEIAEQLGISVGTSKSNLFKAKAYLQKVISKETQQAGICNL
jgi:RNA polymerase sigma-70 factor (ECF subfamily)